MCQRHNWPHLSKLLPFISASGSGSVVILSESGNTQSFYSHYSEFASILGVLLNTALLLLRLFRPRESQDESAAVVLTVHLCVELFFLVKLREFAVYYWTDAPVKPGNC